MLPRVWPLRPFLKLVEARPVLFQVALAAVLAVQVALAAVQVALTAVLAVQVAQAAVQVAAQAR